MDNEVARLLMLQSLQVAGGVPAHRHRGLFASLAAKGKRGRRIPHFSTVNLGDHCRRHAVGEVEFPTLFTPAPHLVCLNLTAPAHMNDAVGLH